ncbi:MAG TPA: MMPL family transporter, partial [Gaiellaceae bacterium]|nr:MMPL family transporter [Gaiellaceae bacterium]
MVERSLGRLAGAMSRRRRAVVAGWLVVLAAGAWFSLHQSDHLSGGGWEVPGSPSVRVVDALRRFPNPTRVQSTFLVVVTDPNGPRDRLQEVRLLAERDPQVHSGRPIVLDGGVAILPLAYTGRTSTAIDEASRLRHLLVDRRTRVIGEAAIWSNFQDVSKRQLARGEALGFPLILLILLAGFGTLVAALAPLALGAVAVFLSGAVIYLLSRSTVVSVYVTNMASMIGIGVAVDYSLFVLARYREEVRAGRPPAQARPVAMATSGLAVIFSGLTVIVSLGGLFMVDNTAIRSMALGAILVVAVSLLASASLLPVLIRLLGHRAYVR